MKEYVTLALLEIIVSIFHIFLTFYGANVNQLIMKITLNCICASVSMQKYGCLRAQI